MAVKQVDPTPQTDRTKIPIEKDNFVEVRPAFDVDKFRDRADSLLKIIASAKIELTYSIDTLTFHKNDTMSMFYPLLNVGKVSLTRYAFDPGKGNRFYRLFVVEAIYPDTISASKAYAGLSKNALEDGTKGDFSPGLTYTNDFVIKSPKSLYWVSTPCAYASFNHNKIKSILLKCLTLKNPTDSIHCECGAPKCDVSGVL